MKFEITEKMIKDARKGLVNIYEVEKDICIFIVGNKSKEKKK